MEGTPEPSGGSERPRGQWTVQQIKKALDLKSLEQYRILYTDLERVMDENGLLGANFGVIKNKTALRDLFPAMVLEHCSEHTIASSGSIKEALLHLAHKINTSTIKKANREKSLKPRPLRRKKTGSGPLLEASTRPNQEGSHGVCKCAYRLTGDEIVAIRRDDGTVNQRGYGTVNQRGDGTVNQRGDGTVNQRGDGIVIQKCRLKVFCRKKASGKILLYDVSREMLIAYLVREKIMSSLHEPFELYHHSTVDGVYPCHNEEFFRSAVSEEVMRGHDTITFSLRRPSAHDTNESHHSKSICK